MSRKLDVSTSGASGPNGQHSLDPTWLLGLGGAAVMLAGCRLVGDVFRAGVFVGVVGIILFVAIFLGLIRLLMD